MKLPVRRVTRPDSVIGESNGKLPRAIMLETPGTRGGAAVLLVAPAARAWRAMVAAAAADGIDLKVGSRNNAYRPYADQERIFLARYYPSILGVRFWNGKRWRKRPGVAAAAVPGTSNHGWGLAVDIGEELDGDIGTESISQRAVNWLIANAHYYGFSAEIQSEPWHWRYFAGDEIPLAVLIYEQAPQPGANGMQLVNDSKQRRMFATWPKDGTEHVDEYGTYIPGVGVDMPNISYVIDDQVAKGNMVKAG